MKPRIHGMDALRAIAMLLGIVLHAAIAYRAFPNAIWPHDTYQWIGYDGLYLWIHAFRMQVFFLVAGFFARLLYLKIGEQAFLRHRAERIVIPFVVGIIGLVPLSVAPFWYYEYVEIQGMTSREAFSIIGSNIVGWNGLVHLWFLYYLLLFYAAMMVVIRLAERFSSLKKLGHWASGIADLTRPASLGIIFMVIMAALYYRDSLVIEAYTGIKPDPAQLVYYGIFFLVGYWMHQRREFVDKITKYAVGYLTLGTLLTVLFVYLYALAQRELAMDNTYTTLTRSISAGQTILLVGGVLGSFIRFFSEENRVLRYVSDSAYWLYLVHLPLVVVFQIALLNSPIPGGLRFWVVVGLTTLIALVTYQAFVRYTQIGMVLHGKRNKIKRDKLV